MLAEDHKDRTGSFAFWPMALYGDQRVRPKPHYLRATSASLACRASASPTSRGLKSAYGSKLSVFNVPTASCASSALGPDPYGTCTTYTVGAQVRRSPLLWKQLNHPSERPLSCVNEARPRSWMRATETFTAFGESLGHPPVLHAQGVGLDGARDGGGASVPEYANYSGPFARPSSPPRGASGSRLLEPGRGGRGGTGMLGGNGFGASGQVDLGASQPSLSRADRNAIARIARDPPPAQQQAPHARQRQQQQQSTAFVTQNGGAAQEEMFVPPAGGQ